MKVFIVLAVIAAIVALILSVWIKIIVEYDSTSESTGFLSVKLRVLFVTRTILPEKREKVNPSNFSYKKLQKLHESELKKQNKAIAKKKKNTKGTPKKKPSPVTVSNIPSLLESLKDTVGEILKKFVRHLHVDVRRFKISIGGEDAAATALMYSAVSQGAAYIFEILENYCKVYDKRKSKTSAEANFLSLVTTADIKFVFRLRIIHLLDLLISTAISYIKTKNKQNLQGEKNHERTEE